MGKSTDRTLVLKTSLTASKRSLSRRRSLAVPWVLYQNIFAEGWLGEGESCAGIGARAAGRTTDLRSLTSKVHSKTCGSIKGHCVRTRPGDWKEMWQKSSTGWKEETHRIWVISIESHFEHFSSLSCPQASWRRWFAPPAGLGPLSRNYSGNCFAEHDTWFAILCWNGGYRGERGF